MIKGRSFSTGTAEELSVALKESEPEAHRRVVTGLTGTVVAAFAMAYLLLIQPSALRSEHGQRGPRRLCGEWEKESRGIAFTRRIEAQDLS